MPKFSSTYQPGRSGRDRYNRMIKIYKQTQSHERGIPQRQVKVKGSSESAKKFKEFYQLLRSKNKPSNYRQVLGELGFGRAFWAAYKTLRDKDQDQETDEDAE